MPVVRAIGEIGNYKADGGNQQENHQHAKYRNNKRHVSHHFTCTDSMFNKIIDTISKNVKIMGGLIMEKLILPLPSEGKKKKHPQSRNGSAAGDNNSIMEFVNKGVDGFQIIFVVGRRRRNIEHRVFDIAQYHVFPVGRQGAFGVILSIGNITRP